MDNTKIFDDLADLASTALGTLAGLKDQVRDNARGHAESFAVQMDLATRTDMDRLDGMIAKLRGVQDELNKRVAVIEEILLIKPETKKVAVTPTKKAPAAKAVKTPAKKQVAAKAKSKTSKTTSRKTK